jgi:CRP-like cAMP-binding protein
VKVRALESALALLGPFRGLRPDERLAIAARFQQISVAPGESWHTAEPGLVLLIEGQARLAGGTTLVAGDSLGEVEVATGEPLNVTLTAVTPARLALLDGAGLDALFAEHPVTALPWLRGLGRELKWRNDLLRELSLAFAENLPPAQLEALLARRRRRLQRHRKRRVRSALAAVGRALFTAPGSRPSFWVLLGALSALAAARTVVALIISNGLQKHLFALIGGKVGHPIHVHHFNYGLLLVSLVSILLLLPRPRSALKRLAFVFGFGLGLIVDEFALLWNLNPDYYQPQSRLAAGLLLIAIVQIVYVRNWWGALFRRLVGR